MAEAWNEKFISRVECNLPAMVRGKQDKEAAKSLKSQ